MEAKIPNSIYLYGLTLPNSDIIKNMNIDLPVLDSEGVFYYGLYSNPYSYNLNIQFFRNIIIPKYDVINMNTWEEIIYLACRSKWTTSLPEIKFENDSEKVQKYVLDLLENNLFEYESKNLKDTYIDILHIYKTMIGTADIKTIREGIILLDEMFSQDLKEYEKAVMRIINHFDIRNTNELLRDIPRLENLRVKLERLYPTIQLYRDYKRGDMRTPFYRSWTRSRMLEPKLAKSVTEYL